MAGKLSQTKHFASSSFRFHEGDVAKFIEEIHYSHKVLVDIIERNFTKPASRRFERRFGKVTKYTS